MRNEDVLKKIRTRRKLTKKFLNHIMRKEILEYVTLTRRIEVSRDREKQRIAYLVSLIKWMEEQLWGETAKNAKVIRSYKGQKNVETYDYQRPEVTRHIEDEGPNTKT